MAAKEQKFAIVVKAQDRFSRVFTKLTNKINGLSGKSYKVNQKLKAMHYQLNRISKAAVRASKGIRSFGSKLTIGLSAPAALAGRAMFNLVYDFEKAMNEVGAVTKTTLGGVVRPEFLQLKKLAQELGATTEHTSRDAALGMIELGRAGFSAAEIIKIVPEVLNMATAANVTIAESSDMVSAAIRSFGLEAKDAARVTDIFSSAAINSATTALEFKEALKMAGPVAKGAGADLAEVAAQISVLANMAIKGSMAGTTLKNFYVKIAKPSELAQKLLKEFNVEISDSAGNIRPMIKILADLAKGMKGLPTKDKMEAINEIFGLRAIAGGSAIVGDIQRSMESGSVSQLANLYDEIKNKSKGVAADVRQSMMLGIVGPTKQAQSAFEGMILSFSKSGFLEMITGLMNAVRDFSNWLNEANGGFKKFLLIFGAFAIVLGPIVALFGIFLAIAGKIGIITIAVAGLVAAIVSLGIVIKDSIISAFDDAMSYAQKFLNFISKVFTQIASKFFNLVGATGLGGILQSLLEPIATGLDIQPPTGLDRGRGAEPVPSAVARAEGFGRGADSFLNVSFANLPTGSSVEATGPAFKNLDLGSGVA